MANKVEEKAERLFVLGKVGSRCQIDAGERNASARKGQSRYRRWDASLSAVAADCASAWAHARGTHTGRHAWKHQRWWNTPSPTGRAARKGRGKERERKCTLARVRASVDKSERRRAESAFLARLRDRQPGRLAASKPVPDFENRVLSERLIACIRKIKKRRKKETDRRELREFFFFAIRNDSLVMDH